MTDTEPTRVLYVEDNAGMARLFQRRLQRSGYDVDLAYDGEEGLRALRSSAYDVLCVDHQMPGMTGLEIIRTLAAEGKLPPTIMITGAGNERISVEAMKLGATDYIIKDSDAGYLELIPPVIEQALEKRHLIEEKKGHDRQLQLLVTDLQRHQLELQARNEELLQAQTQLEGLKNRYEDLYDCAPVGYLNLTGSCLVVEANLTAARLLATERPHLLGQSLLSVVHVDDREAFEDHFARVFSKGESEGCRVRMCRLDGTTFRAQLNGSGQRDKTGKITHCLTALWDVSEQEQAEEQLRKAKEEWERTFDAVPDLIMILDSQFRVERANRAMSVRLGMPAADMLGRHCFELVHGTAGPVELCPHQQTLLSGVEHMEGIFEPRLGTSLLVSCSPLHDEAGNVVGSVHIARDMGKV